MNNFKRKAYKTNTEPKIGDKVRSTQNLEDGDDCLCIVTNVLGGRLGNKITVEVIESDGLPVGDDPHQPMSGLEGYYYCFCPQ